MEQHAALVISGLASLSMFFFAFILNGFRSDIKAIKQEVTAKVTETDKRSKEIETNYNEKFDKVHEKFDKVNEKLDIVLEKVAEQAGFCKAVQEQKKVK